MIRFIGACNGWGAQIKQCEEGPLALSEHLPSIWKTSLLYPRIGREIPDLLEDFNRRLAFEVHATLQQNEFPLIFGGDHSIAVGTWNGVNRYLMKKGSLPLGLIWLDAHLDSHILETTPSNAWHGMPVAALLGHGDPCMSRLLQNEAVIDPKHLIIIGARSYEKEEKLLLKHLGVRIYEPEEISCLKSTLLMAYLQLKTTCGGIGLSLDLDLLDPNEAPGVGSPEEKGVSFPQLQEALLSISSDLVAFEIVEFNPARDVNGQTLGICLNLLDCVIYRKRSL